MQRLSLQEKVKLFRALFKDGTVSFVISGSIGGHNVPTSFLLVHKKVVPLCISSYFIGAKQ